MTKVNSILKLCESKWSIQNFFHLDQNETMRIRCVDTLTSLGLLIPGISAFLIIPIMRDIIKNQELHRCSSAFTCDIILGIIFALGLGLLLLILGTLICLGRCFGQLVCGRNRNNSILAEN